MPLLGNGQYGSYGGNSLLGGGMGGPGFVTDPRTSGLLGLAAGMGAASAPSRLPITPGQVFGAGAGGLLQGQREALTNRLLGGQYTQQQIAIRNAEIQNALLGQRFNILQGALGGTGVGQGPGATGAPQAQPSAAPQGPSYFDRLFQVESGNNPDAKNPNSSASGLAQITDGTFAQLQQQDSSLTSKNDPRAVQLLTKNNGDALSSQLGTTPTNGQLYLAHFLGAAGASKMLAAPPDARAVDYADPMAVTANKNMFYGKDGKELTVGQFESNMEQKFAGTQPLYGAPQQPQGETPYSPQQMANIYKTALQAEVVTPGAGKEILSKWLSPMEIRQGAAAINPMTGQPFFQMPRLPEGARYTPEGTVEMAPNALSAIQQSSTAHAAGPATFEPQNYYGPFGNEYLGTRLGLSGAGQNGTAAPQRILGGAGPIATPTAAAPAAPGAAPQGAAPAQPPNIFATTPLPVTTPNGPKDLSQVSLNDMFPNGQGIPMPPGPPPGMGFGAPSKATEDRQKEDTDIKAGWDKELQGNQKIYQDLAHIGTVIQNGYTSGKWAPATADLTNIAHEYGLDNLIPAGSDPNDAAVFQKAATDLVFAAVKKLSGQVKVAEIQGYQQANPGISIPIEANASIISDVLSAGKWEDQRARLGGEYMTQTGGAPLSTFSARYNQMFPLPDLSQQVHNQLRTLGFKMPEDAQKAASGVPSGPDLTMFPEKNRDQAGTIISNFSKGMYGDPNSPEARAKAKALLNPYLQ